MTINMLRACLLTTALASGAATAQIKPVSPVEPEQVPAETRGVSQIHRPVQRAQTAKTMLAQKPYVGTMDCNGGGMDVEVQVLRRDGLDHYGLEMIFQGSNTAGPGTCSISGGFRQEGLLDGKARLSFVFPLAQLRKLNIRDGRLEQISTHPSEAGKFITAAVEGGWFRLRVREVQDVGAMPLYLVDEVVERRF